MRLIKTPGYLDHLAIILPLMCATGDNESPDGLAGSTQSSFEGHYQINVLFN